MSGCIFCKIINNEVPSGKVYEDEDFIIIRDIQPKAKNHFLAIPKNHYPYLKDMNNNDAQVMGRIMAKIPNLEEELGLEGGYRLIINQGENGGQAVFHLHIHILSGEKLAF